MSRPICQSLCILLALAATLAACQSSPLPAASEIPVEKDLAAIQKVLEDQVTAWNEGDIHAFMKSYWASDSLRFASGGSERRGWQTTLERYLTTYPTKEAMGHLTFKDLDMRRLSGNWATVFGRYHLKRDESLGDLTGLFTLLFEKRPEGWVIVHDHTSAG